MDEWPIEAWLVECKPKDNSEPWRWLGLPCKSEVQARKNAYGNPVYEYRIRLCEECGQPTKPGRHQPGEYDHAQGCPNAPPKALQQIADVVLNYRPKSKQPRPRKRKKAKRAI